MQRSLAMNLGRQILRHSTRIPTVPPLGSVFINHRGIDTKENVAGLIYDDLTRMGLRAFLDSKSMKPGDKLFDKIDSAIRNCKAGICVFSPRYCESYFCLHELSLLMENQKKVIPIFVDLKPSELRVKDDGSCPAEELKRFSWALNEARYTVGLTFDTTKGDWSRLVKETSNAVMRNLLEVDGEWPLQINGKRTRMY